ncbi:ADP-heptose--LPS heptosyltransferase [Desulfosarcina widdelii]|uniref:lipopolysaccharide heptosyltransferase II n=1 Tax=Desulfosarcina widdelii TaxID=947919 RepID=A0A5K7ZQC9_9BACT|nr:lipopolysaccharide heptosyltransferase II [Desulfosarcina widdelii]BBO79297.1 ADP-heptose--LPS heptosyltransferase [Desulfosarcina widdelii]
MSRDFFKRSDVKRLLIRSTNWIGDAVMTTPAVRAIRRHFPGASISLLAKPWVAPVFANSPHVDEIIVYEANGRHRGAMGPIRLARDLRRRDFDAAILLQNAIEAALIAFLAGIPMRVGFDTDARRLLLTHPVRCTKAIKAIHQTGYYLKILEGVGIPPRGQILELSVGDTNRQRAKEILTEQGALPGRRVIGLNPSATFGPAKQWFPERFAVLGDRLSRTLDAAIVIFGGPADRDLGNHIAGMMQAPVVDLSGRTSLGEAMALIERCDAFVTNDSGLMHVAAAVNTPLVAVFGSTNSTTTSPFSSTSRIVRVPIECSPCMKPVCPLGHMNCMRQVSVEVVAEAVEGLL